MSNGSELLADINFEGEVIEWRGPAPYFFVVVPSEHVGELTYAARLVSYGWGVVPVEGQVGVTEFATSLFPKDGSFLLPLKAAIRLQEGIVAGDEINVTIRVRGQVGVRSNSLSRVEKQG